MVKDCVLAAVVTASTPIFVNGPQRLASALFCLPLLVYKFGSLIQSSDDPCLVQRASRDAINGTVMAGLCCS